MGNGWARAHKSSTETVLYNAIRAVFVVSKLLDQETTGVFQLTQLKNKIP